MGSLQKERVTAAAHETVEGRQLGGSKAVDVPRRDVSVLPLQRQLGLQGIGRWTRRDTDNVVGNSQEKLLQDDARALV